MNNNNEYLAHHGIKGQRWGVEHGPPYPVRRGSGGKPKTTNIVKSKLKEDLEKRSEAKKAKQTDRESRIARIKDQYAERKAEAEVRSHERLKERVVKNPALLYKNRKKFDRAEIDQLVKEIEFDRKLKDIRQAEIKRGLEQYKRVQEGFNTTAQLLVNGKQIYNVAAGTYNMLVDSGKVKGNKWTLIQDQPAKKKGGDNDSKKDDD